MAQTKVLEMSLEKVTIDNDKTKRKGHTRRLVIATLIWPRPLINDSVSVKTVDFQNNAADLSEMSWTEKILFKERVSGPFGLKIDVSDHLTESQAAEFIPFLGSSIFKHAGTEAKKMMETTFEGNLIKLPFEYITKMITDSAGKAPKTPNSGMVDLDPSKTWSKKRTVRIDIPLKAHTPIYKTTRNKRGKGSNRKLLVKAGDINGTVTVTAKLY
jgi:hypothetical protein